MFWKTDTYGTNVIQLRNTSNVDYCINISMKLKIHFGDNLDKLGRVPSNALWYYAIL